MDMQREEDQKQTENDELVPDRKTPEEILNIQENYYHERQEYWNKELEKLSFKINGELKDTILLSAETISYRQILLEERTNQYYKMHKSMIKYKEFNKQRVEFYLKEYQFKVTGPEKKILLDADMKNFDCRMEYSQNYINFLTETIKNIDHIIWSVKNKIELYNLTAIE